MLRMLGAVVMGVVFGFIVLAGVIVMWKDIMPWMFEHIG